MENENEGRLDRVKRHLKDNKKTYLIGAGCLAAGYFLRRPGTTAIINNVAPSIAPVFNNTVNNGGHCTKIVQRLSDKEIFEQAAEAAFDIAEKYGITYDRARWMLSRHLNGHLADVFGETYKTIGLSTTA
jgi:hypothetical protein